MYNTYQRKKNVYVSKFDRKRSIFVIIIHKILSKFDKVIISGGCRPNNQLIINKQFSPHIQLVRREWNYYFF